MATAAPNWWENDPVAHPPAPAAPAEPYVVGTPRPRLPTPQTAPQAQHDILENARLTQQIDTTPLSNANTEATTERTRQTTRQSDTRGANFQDENALRQQYRQNPSVQAYESILPIYRAAQTAADNTAGDLQLVYSFSKMMDPGSVVRESETAAVGAAGSLGQRAQGYVDYISGHGRLTPEMRQQLLAEMAARGANLNRDYIRFRNDMVRDAERYGFDPHAIVGQHAAIPYRQQMGLDRPSAQLRPTAGQSPDHSGEAVAFWDDPVAPREYSPRDPTAGMTQAAARLQQMFDQGATREALDRAAVAAGQQPFGPDLDAAIRWRDQHGRGARIVAPTLPPERTMPQGDPNSVSEAVGANIRGATSAATAGLDHPLAAAYHTLADGGSFQENLWRENEYDRANQEAHPWSTLAGNLEGALALPTGAAGAGRSAATQAMRAGLSRGEAVAAARAAVGRRLATEGAIYGGIHGTATGDGSFRERLGSGAVEAALGGLTGFAGRFGPGYGRTATRPNALSLVDPQTGRLNALLEDATPAQRMAAAQQHGIDLPMGAATDRGGAIIEKGLDVSPVSAGIMNDARRGTEAQTANALENVAGRYGQARTMDEAGNALQSGARNWINRATVEARPEQPSVIARAYNGIPISPKAEASLANTRAALDRLTSRFQSNPELAALEQNRQLVQYRDALASGGLSWEDMKGLRSEIGDRIGAERFSDSPSRNDLRALYAALSEDMRATAASQGPRALRAFERANNLNRNVENRIEGALVRLLGDDSRNNPERAAAAIQTIARSGRGSANIQQLEQIRASLTKGGAWDEAAAALIRLGGQPSGAEGRGFSPQTFLNWYSGMTEDARQLLFSGGGRDALRQNLDSFVAVAQRLAGTNALRNTSNTTPGLIGAGTVSGLGTAILAGLLNPLTAVKVGAGIGANYGLARLWTNPSFVRWATGYAKMAQGVARARSQPSAVTLQRQRTALARIARSSPAIADAVADLDRHIFGGATAAEQPATPGQ